MNRMSGAKSQGKRIAKLSTPLGDDVLVASRLDGSEGMSQLFEFRIEGLSSDADLDLDALIGRNATMSLETPDLDTRHFDGIVVEAEWSGQRYDDHVYRMVLRPWFWLLSRRTDCKIFHEKTAPQIVEEVMGAHSFALFQNRLTKSYPKLEYTVQYRESDLAFCCRMMEKHGIGYYFVHEPGQHTLVMSDSVSSYETIPGGSRPFIPKAQREHVDGEHVYLMVPQRRFTSGKVAMTAYDFKKPSAAMATDARGVGGYEHAELEVFDYPGKYVETDAGSGYSSAVMSAETGRDRRRMVGGDLPSATPGQLMSVTGHPRAAENQEYLILSATHAFAAQGYRSGVNDEDAYHGTYELLPAESGFAPPQVTDKASIPGPQTAMVVGEGEIDVDEFGRILVHFHWDRYGDKSKRLRVSQHSAQGQWGGITTPRIGQEVVVEFLEGDPDEPLVTGTVYHAQNMPPYQLPANKTRTVNRSNTHQGKGFNEITFEDQAGGENMFFHAQKDQTTRVLNNRTKRVDANEVASVGANRSVEVGQHQKTEIGGSMNMVVGGTGAGALGLMSQVAGLAGQTAGLLNQAGAIAGGAPNLGSFAGSIAQTALGFLSSGGLGSRQGVVAGSNPRADAGTALAGAGTGMAGAVGSLFQLPGIMNTVVGNFQSTTVGVAQVDQVGTSKVVNVGQSFVTSVGKTHILSVGEAAETKVGKTNIIDVGETFEITAGEKFSITVGKSKLTMDKMGVVTIEGAISVIAKGGPVAQLTVGPGPILYVPVLVPGKTPIPPGTCLKRMAQAGAIFTRG